MSTMQRFGISRDCREQRQQEGKEEGEGAGGSQFNQKVIQLGLAA